MLAALAVLAAGAVPAAAPAPPLVHYTAKLGGTRAFVGISRRGSRFRAYLSDATPKRTSLSVWFKGAVAPDGRLSATSYDIQLSAQLERGRGNGTVTLRDGRVLPFAATSGFGGGLVDRPYRYRGVHYRSGWIVMSDNRVRGRTMISGTAFDGTSESGPGIRPTPTDATQIPPEQRPAICAQVKEDEAALDVQSGRLSHQSGQWELRLNRGRGSGSAYNRLNWARGALDEMRFELERYRYRYAACDSPSVASLSSAGPVSARKSTRTSLNA